ncbi:MAG TPA: phosphoribosylamine--glycine ligase [Thermodesulfobacteriota bacterium]|nr:phosphoribosylamine--glycine ligase [Thermodesulfobacteriota bacterium]
MKVLVIGSGGREHALAWKLSQSSLVKKVFTAPGNAGTALEGENVPVKADDIEGLKGFALKEGVDLTVVGPELPLTLGIVDEFVRAGLKVFGPTKRAAEIEGSKSFTKDLMVRNNIPTASYEKFRDPEAALAYIESRGLPVVVKADGLAAGKGVAICATMEEAAGALDLTMRQKAFGGAGGTVVVEEFLEGEEASYLAITDGENIVPLATAQDHKAIYDGDRGPNTGGMGAYSPAPVVTPELEDEIRETIIAPVVRAMADEDRPYTGVIYAGLMIKEGRPRVLEFNCRFGDPETQPMLMRLEGDLFDLLISAVEGRLKGVELDWSEKSSVCVVMAAGGYPGKYEKGNVIHGLEEARKMEDVMVFHAGTTEKDGRVVTSGGRVLGVTGLGDGIKEAMERTYDAVGKISWEGAYYRKDIGRKAIR